MKALVLAGLASLGLVATASAEFTGFAVDEYFSGNKFVVDLYATSDDPNDVLLGVKSTTISLEGGYGQLVHNNLVPGSSWSPVFTTPGMESMDSFVTLGGAPGFSNTTTTGMNWGAIGFNQVGIPPLAGWFNFAPENPQGQAMQITAQRLFNSETYAGPATLLMRMVFFEANVDSALQFSFAGTLEWNQGLSTPTTEADLAFSTFLFNGIPAPGAFAVMALGALGGRSRRRRR